MTSNLNENVKKLIRSQLLSLPEGITLRNFSADYAELNGEPPPIKKLGFRNLREYLQSVPDVVTMVTLPNDVVILKGVPNQETVHIKKMIDEQKSFSPSVQTRQVQQAIKTALSYNSGHHINHPRGYEKRSQPRRRSDSHYQLFQSTSAEQTNQTGQRSAVGLLPNSRPPLLPTPPYSLSDLQLHSVPNILKPPLLPTPVLGSHFLLPSPPVHNLKEPVVPMLQKNLPPLLETLPFVELEDSMHKIKISATIEAPNDITKPESQMAEIGNGYKQQQLFEDTSQSRIQEGNVLINSVLSERNSKQLDFEDDDIRQYSLLTIEDIILLLRKFPSGIYVSEFPDVYQSLFGKPFCPEDLGYNGMVDLVCSLDYLFQVYQSSDGSGYKLFDARKGPFMPLRDKYFRDSTATIPEDIRNDVVRFLETSTKLRALNFIGCFELTTQSKLDYFSYGFDSIEACFRGLEVCKALSVVYERGVAIVHKYKPELYYPFSEEIMKLYTTEVVGPQEGYTEVKIPPAQEEGSLETNNYIDVYVCEIMSPSKFFFQLAPRDNLHILMKNLGIFYKNPESDKYKITEDFGKLLMGQVCAALYENEWHRGKIWGKTHDIYTIYYVDYGTEFTCRREDLRLLHRQFFDLPAQSIEAKLYGVEPRKILREGWHIKCRVFFKDSFLSPEDMNTVVKALVLDTDEERHSVVVKLYFMLILPHAESIYPISYNKLMVLNGCARDSFTPRPPELPVTFGLRTHVDHQGIRTERFLMVRCHDDFPGLYFHIVNVRGLPYILCSELCMCFPMMIKYFHRMRCCGNLMAKILYEEDADVEPIKITRDKLPQFFEEMKGCEVAGWCNYKTKVPVNVATLYPMKKVILIGLFIIFKSSKEAAKKALIESGETFVSTLDQHDWKYITYQ